MEGNRFSLPSKINPDDLEEYLSSRQCQVVAFFGKTPLHLKSNKGNFIDDVIGQSVFSNRDIDHDVNDNIEPLIEGYYCPDRDVIFLHMRSWMDTFSMAEKCRQAEDLLEHKAQLRFERHMTLHKLFLNVWGERTHSSILEASVSLVLTNHTAIPLTPHLFLYVLMRVSQI